MESISAAKFRVAPFDAAACVWRKRMGLLTSDEEPDASAVNVIARMYASLLYGHLCETLPGQDVACRELIARAAKQDAPQKMLTLCSVYDAIYLSLPEPIWWISGDLKLASAFVDSFFAWLSVFTGEMEVI
ncbi:hypothetical protein H8790_11545 [Oscillibacter hominis]|uniref:Uncharacterized protein n=1 Tax=Oscillibacter hominis TaxID=2763056 RepID=A0A7G9B3D6_9FIRM|nr:hypothetical protein [Oscillibacter hominis]QNL44067.1 hypothetical protein H8790_11545 [Oscillibacter hominis]